MPHTSEIEHGSTEDNKSASSILDMSKDSSSKNNNTGARV